MKPMPVIVWTLFLVGILSPQPAHVCCVCVDYILDWHTPFSKQLLLIFAIWGLLKHLFLILGKISGTPIMLTHLK
ncbi:MAG: hypothetical protein C0624_01590 [Desulfuromonas sp.]|mgnify:CR=1 FL=1|nr:MAG: hypothetical protein C0624_01590 [Desulfuromonas sp.]